MPTPRRPEEDDVLPALDEGAAREFSHLPFLDRRLKAEVELLEAATERQRRHLLEHLNGAPVKGGDLLSKEALDELGVAPLVPGRFFSERRQVLGEME